MLVAIPRVPDGAVHIRVYRVWSGSALNSYALAVATVSRSGGPFQAMLETQRLTDMAAGLREQLAAFTAEWEELMLQLD